MVGHKDQSPFKSSLNPPPHHHLMSIHSFSPLIPSSLFHRLSLLELVLDVSVSMVLSRMSPSSGLEDIDTSPAKRIHGWSRICSRVGLSEGRNDRHHLISCWHSLDTLLLKYSLPWRISSSCSKGMSPQTMSYSSTPSDHTVAERPWYLWKRIHSGGLYTLVPSKSV